MTFYFISLKHPCFPSFFWVWVPTDPDHNKFNEEFPFHKKVVKTFFDIFFSLAKMLNGTPKTFLFSPILFSPNFSPGRLFFVAKTFLSLQFSLRGSSVLMLNAFKKWMAGPRPPPKATMDLVDHPILRERMLEDMFFEGALAAEGAPPIPNNIIINVTAGFSVDRNFVVLFNTKEHRYGIVIVLDNHLRLSWKECRALRDAFTLAEKGSTADNRKFKEWHSKLQSSYLDCSLITQNQRWLLAVNPGQGNTRFQSNSIQTNKFDIVDSKAIFKLQTSSHEFQISAILLTPNQGVGVGIIECQCLADLFTMTETGDLMTPDLFLAWCLKLVAKFKLVNVNPTPRGFVAEIFPTRLKEQRVFSPCLLEWLEKQKTPSGGVPQFPGFETQNLLVESGQAIVYRGKKTSTGEKVAIKVYKSADDLDEYTIELKALTKLGDHPNVVGLMGYFERPRPCIVMQFIEGMNLRDFLDKVGLLSERRAVKLGLGMAKGLAHLHAEGFIHRDVKSPNVMVDSSEHPIIIDMGLGKDVEVQSTVFLQSSKIRGSVLWMAPEMMERGEYSSRTDVFAFGVMLWEMLSGKTPYHDFSEESTLVRLMNAIKHPRKPLRPTLSCIPSSVSPYLIDLAQACWHPDPKKRPRMRDVVKSLETNKFPLQASINFKKKALIEGAFAKVDIRNVGSISKKQFVLFVAAIEPDVAIPGAEALFDLMEQKNSGGSSSSHEDKRITLTSILEFWKELEEKGLCAVDKIRTISTFDGNPLVARDPRALWGVEDVASRLSAMGLGIYVDTFRNNKVDGRALIGLGGEGLKRLGVDSELHRIRIQKMHLENDPRVKNYLAKYEKLTKLKAQIVQKEEEKKEEKRKEEERLEEVRRLEVLIKKKERERKQKKIDEERARKQKKIEDLEKKIKELETKGKEPSPTPATPYSSPSSRQQRVIELRQKLSTVVSDTHLTPEQIQVSVAKIEQELDSLVR